MPSANLQINIIRVVPPSLLGTSQITLMVGETIQITKQMLMASSPTYSQPQNFDIGSVKIMGSTDIWYRALDFNQTNSGRRIKLQNNSLTIGKTSSAANAIIQNNIISSQNILQNKFEVTGISIGTTNVTYVATAIEETTESEYSTNTTGRLVFNVISNVNNPPSFVGNSSTFAILGMPKILTMSFFNQQYTDPENDPISQVKITSVSSGTLQYNFSNITSYPFIITASDIQMGKLRYIHASNATVNTIANIVFTVSDTGSGLFY